MNEERAPLAYGRKNRIEALDAVRGFCIILVILYHLGNDLAGAGIIPEEAIYNPVLNILEAFFAGVFILVSGVCTKFSRNNLKRGILILLAAALISAATFWADHDLYVRFGILHLLGFSIIVYQAGRRLFDALPALFAAPAYLILFAATYGLSSKVFNIRFLWFLGITYEEFASSDYFPLLPWIFIFLLGVCIGGYVASDKLPRWFYEFKGGPLAFIGGKTIWIYLIHQPVILFILWILGKI